MRALLAAALASVALTSQAAPTNLVVNGGFESQVVTAGSWVNVGSLPGWTWVGGPGTGIEIRNNAVGSAHGGNNFIELDTTGNTTIEQVFTGLTGGGQYKLSFWYSPRIGQPTSTNGIGVTWNGLSLTPTPISATGGDANVWTAYRFDVVALGGSDALRFSALGTSDSLGGNLDDVSLTARVPDGSLTAELPEPATGALTLVALAALGWARRRRA